MPFRLLPFKAVSMLLFEHTGEDATAGSTDFSLSGFLTDMVLEKLSDNFCLYDK